MDLTHHIEIIVKKSENFRFSGSAIRSLKPHLRPLTEYLQLTERQVMLFSLILYNTLEDGSADLSSLARHYDVPVMRLLRWKDELDLLLRRRLIRQQENRFGFDRSPKTNYYVHGSVIDGLLRKRLYSDFGKITDNFGFITRVAKDMEAAEDDLIRWEYLKADFLSLCGENKSLFTAKRMLACDLNAEDRMLLIFLAHKHLNGENDISVTEACKFLDHDKPFQLTVRRSLVSGKNKLLTRELLEAEPGAFRNDSRLNITDKGLEYLLGEEAEQFRLQSDRVKSEILPAAIPEVRLWLNAEEQRQIDTLLRLFEKNRFDGISQNMKAIGMKSGFTVLFHGKPGTGKTESVYQLARRTGRSILPVEISETKSMWFGESEKLIRGVFKRYERLLSASITEPILLFNEADGIFGRRTTRMDAPVSQTLNAMQNIILQQMEDFEGILIATTNLTDNLDPAFDRRFLYKVRFEIPELPVRMQIMRDKIPTLPPEAVGQLCERYMLTGGQMANIAKKYRIHELLHGAAPDAAAIESLCRHETGLKEKTRLGFHA
ncbi:MAG: ATP-binding protein [Bacteroidales bacterium]